MDSKPEPGTTRRGLPQAQCKHQQPASGYVLDSLAERRSGANAKVERSEIVLGFILGTI